MIWIAPSEKDTGNQPRAGSGLKAREYPAPMIGFTFRGLAGLWGSPQGAHAVVLNLALALLLCGCSTNAPRVMYVKQDLGVVTDVQPLVVQPNLAKWRELQVGMTEAAVTALLGQPYRKDPRPAPDTEPGVTPLYAWDYGEVSFKSFTTQGSYRFVVNFHEGVVEEIKDPWNGKFSTDGHPTVPELVLPHTGQTLDHYPRFMDFRWHPASGVYPIEYEIVIESLSIEATEAENYEAYIQKTVDDNRPKWQSSGMSKKDMDALAVSFAQHLRQDQGVVDTYEYRTHDIYLPFTWVGTNTGRWRIRATNDKGTSDWTGWRYFKFSI